MKFLKRAGFVISMVIAGCCFLLAAALSIGRMMRVPVVDDPAAQEQARVEVASPATGRGNKKWDNQLLLEGAVIFVEYQLKNMYSALRMTFDLIAVREDYVTNPGWAPKDGLVFKVTGTASYKNMDGQTRNSLIGAIVTTDFKLWSLHALEVDGELVE